jgi:xanthine dehydrogenase/oxidase
MDIPFPERLMSSEKPKIPFIMSKDEITWLEPSNLDELLKAKSLFPQAKIIGGNSEVSIELKFKAAKYRTFINVHSVHEFNNITTIYNQITSSAFLEIGCNITLSNLIIGLKNLKANCEQHHLSLLDAFLSNLIFFASRQIRNFATLGGNIVTGSPISDLNPILVANNAILTVLSESNGIRTIPIREFYLGYRKIDLKPDEVLLKLRIEMPENELEIVRAYKQSKRKEDDIAIVNGCFRVKLERVEENQFIIRKLDLSFGGLAPTTIFLPKINSKFTNHKWAEEKTLKSIHDELLNEISLTYSVPGGMPVYRRTLAVSFFTKFWYQVIKEAGIKITNDSYLNHVDDIKRCVSSGNQEVGKLAENDYCIGTTNSHMSGLNQTTGVAKYLDDIPKQHGELYTGFVLSTQAHAYIKSIDASEALALEGVIDFITYKDVPYNNFGVGKDEEVFASKEVLFYGQLIGFILAETRHLAKYAASLVRIEYEPLKPILTIKDAIENNSFYSLKREVKKGEFDADTFSVQGTADILVEGELDIGGQEHFYLETHGCLAIPKNEDNEMTVYSSTQNVNDIQKEASNVLKIPANRIVSKIKRIGGGFGGKENRSTHIALAVMVAAKKSSRPVRCILDRDIDMLITGARHPFYGKYKLRITKDGYFKAYEVDLINNGGHSLDLSFAALNGAIYRGMDNAYMFPKIKISGKVAKTNVASNTA